MASGTINEPQNVKTDRITSTSLNDVKLTGLYYCYNVSDMPTTSGYGFLIVIRGYFSTEDIKQMWIQNTGTSMYVRRYYNDSWSDWSHLS